MNQDKKAVAGTDIIEDDFFDKVEATKLTEARKLKLHSKGWGVLTQYYLESTKITWQKKGVVRSAATIKIGDRSGEITCVVTGPTVGLLFGLSEQEWGDIEKLCGKDHQLFYRQFKNGISENFRFEQKLFYNFCLSNQKADVLVAVFHRSVNMRHKDNGNAFLNILELRKCDIRLMDLYLTKLMSDNRK